MHPQVSVIDHCGWVVQVDQSIAGKPAVCTSCVQSAGVKLQETLSYQYLVPTLE